MITTYREPAERPDTDVPVGKAISEFDAAAKRKRRAANFWMALGIVLQALAFLNPLIVALAEDGVAAFTTTAAVYIALIAMLAASVLGYEWFLRRVESRSPFSQKLARETEQFLQAEENKEFAFRVFLPPMPTTASSPSEPLERSAEPQGDGVKAREC
jgi:hypothetical protein